VASLVYQTEENTINSVDNFKTIGGLLLSICTACPSFIEHFPSQHLLVCMKVCLEKDDNGDNSCVVGVLRLLDALLVAYPSMKNKCIGLQFSDAIIPLVERDTAADEVQEVATSLQQKLYPDWRAPTLKTTQNEISKDTLPQIKREERDKSRLSKTSSKAATPESNLTLSLLGPQATAMTPSSAQLRSQAPSKSLLQQSLDSADSAQQFSLFRQESASYSGSQGVDVAAPVVSLLDSVGSEEPAPRDSSASGKSIMHTPSAPMSPKPSVKRPSSRSRVPVPSSGDKDDGR
jgi:hypothetical protein